MGSLPLYFGLAAIACSIMLLVFALRGGATDESGPAGALRAIERDYAGKRSARLADWGSTESALMAQFRALALRLSPQGVIGKYQERLDYAGNPGGWSPERMLSFKGLGLVIGVFASALFILQNPGFGLLLILAFAAIGFFLPDLLLYNTGLKRQESIGKMLPDVLDLLVVSVESGLGFDAALLRVGRNTQGALAGELIRVMQEIQIGKSREEALRALSSRSSVVELRAFINALIQASDLGIPIGKVLREQAGEMRIKRRQSAEEKAQKLAVKITIPVIFCLFPALFLVLLGPGLINYLDNNPMR